jgi:hypothetical protein
MLRERGITDRLIGMEGRAAVFRRNAEEFLLREDPEKIKNEGLYLFYPAEESEEFE